MPSTPPPGGPLFVESLEARIAPTGLLAIANNPNSAGDPNYVTYTTAPSEGHLGFVPVNAVNQYGLVIPAGSAPVYAMKFTGNNGVDANGNSTGDQLVLFNPTQGFNGNPLVQATNSSVIAFFTDLNHDNQVQNNELTGISLAKRAGVDVSGNVNGDIVTNLSKDGNTVLAASVGKPNPRGTAVSNINVVGNVFGSIVAGGNLTGVSVTGNVDNILAGTVTNGFTYHFSQTANGGGNPVSVAAGTIVNTGYKAGQIGATISGVSVLSVTGTIHAGDGGFSAVGGDVLGVTVQNDTDGFNITAGNGGFGNVTAKGGAGGDVNGVLVSGVADTGVHGTIKIQAGDGGGNAERKGGTGGSVNGVGTSLASFDASTNAFVQSADFLNDNIILQAGKGGDGLKGGAGGGVSNSVLFGAIPDQNDPDNAEIKVYGGDGGIGSGGKGGIGGSINQVNARNVDINADALESAILIQAGNGVGGKFGGDVTAVTLLSSRLFVIGGNGGDGTNRGGDGGSINTVKVLNTATIFTHDLTLNAGQAGSASTGFGGIGGDVTAVSMNDAHLDLLVINDGTHANGGTSGGSIGGAGGAVNNLTLGDSGPALTAAATVTIRTGAGGNGLSGGGNGGDINAVQFFGSDFAYTVTTGTGGSVVNGGAGDGGAGGSFVNVGISNQPFAVNGANFLPGATGTVIAGVGGNGTVAGGAGGDLSQVSLRTTDDVTMTAGNGGTGGSGAAGAGGLVTGSAAIALLGSVNLHAGNGGAGGGAAGDGGSITGFIAEARDDITMVSGNGGAGGAGGDIVNSGTTLNELFLQPNFGNVTITAGNGSTANTLAGAGGSITTFNGYIGYGFNGGGTTNLHTTSLTAGNGGGGADEKHTGAGGSVTNVKLTGNNLTTGAAGLISEIITIDAGDAGVSNGTARKGGIGGEVNTVTIFNLDSGALVHHVAAGNGASAIKKGGAGGSIAQVHVGTAQDGRPDDIGIRTGRTFGYGVATGAGGLFAGTGGTGIKAAGAPGNVTDITANAIAAIVAGKTGDPQLAGTVDSIYLNFNTDLAANANGSVANIGTANFVGSIVNPNVAGATTFKNGDGIIAALNLTQNRSFTPEAYVTIDGNGNRVLVDNRQPGTPVTTVIG